jgi:hypothetical protein
LDLVSRLGEELLDHPLRALVVLFAEMMMPDPTLSIDEVERRPRLVRERAPDREAIVHRNRVVDTHPLQRGPNLLDVVLERELR